MVWHKWYKDVKNLAFNVTFFVENTLNFQPSVILIIIFTYIEAEILLSPIPFIYVARIVFNALCDQSWISVHSEQKLVLIYYKYLRKCSQIFRIN